MTDTPRNRATRKPLAAVVWPTASDGSNALRNIALVAFGILLLALSAKITLPLPYVPMTLQTLVVVMLGAAYGSRLGAITVLAYLAVGAAGLPVFASSVSGLAPFSGATAGFLFGFVIAAFITGVLCERGADQSVPRLFGAMLIGHVVLVACGFAWLAFGMKFGVGKAWSVGVLPFFAGALVKSALGAVLVPTLRKLSDSS